QHSLPGLTAYANSLNIAAIILHMDVLNRKILLDLFGIDSGFINLAHSHNDRYPRRRSMLDCLNSLGLHAVISCNHKDHDVGYVCTSAAHIKEGFMTGSVQERNCLPGRHSDRESTNVLRDSTMLRSGHGRMAEPIKNRGF